VLRVKDAAADDDAKSLVHKRLAIEAAASLG
jgi:hypothetical protein